MSKIIGFFILAFLLNLDHSNANIFKNEQKMFTENEKNSISVFENSVNGVVNVSTLVNHPSTHSFFFAPTKKERFQQELGVVYLG